MAKRHEILPQSRRAPVGDYQFEAIHPFTDGNGRTGRVLNLLFLIEKELLKLPVLYLSGFIIRHKADYYSLLLKVTTDQAWEEWVLFMLRAVHETARWTTSKITAIRDLLDKTADCEDSYFDQWIRIGVSIFSFLPSSRHTM